MHRFYNACLQAVAGGAAYLPVRRDAAIFSRIITNTCIHLNPHASMLPTGWSSHACLVSSADNFQLTPTAAQTTRRYTTAVSIQTHPLCVARALPYSSPAHFLLLRLRLLLLRCPAGRAQ
jgi:hypothetical protein